MEKVAKSSDLSGDLRSGWVRVLAMPPRSILVQFRQFDLILCIPVWLAHQCYLSDKLILQNFSILWVPQLFDNHNILMQSNTNVLEIVNGKNLKLHAHLCVIIVIILLIVVSIWL